MGSRHSGSVNFLMLGGRSRSISMPMSIHVLCSCGRTLRAQPEQAGTSRSSAGAAKRGTGRLHLTSRHGWPWRTRHPRCAVADLPVILAGPARGTTSTAVISIAPARMTGRVGDRTASDAASTMARPAVPTGRGVRNDSRHGWSGPWWTRHPMCRAVADPSSHLKGGPARWTTAPRSQYCPARMIEVRGPHRLMPRPP